MRFNIPANVRVLDYLERCGIDLPTFCNGSGICGRCRIQLIEGELPITPSDQSFLSGQQLENGMRLACCAVTHAPVVLDVPSPPKRPDSNSTGHGMLKPHRYGLVLCNHTAALCDLTAVTVTGICTSVEPVRELLNRYPDAAGGLVRCLCFGETGDIDIAALPCVIEKSPFPDASEEEAVEAGIMKLFTERDQYSTESNSRKRP